MSRWASRGQAAQHRGQSGVMQHSRGVRQGLGSMAEGSGRGCTTQQRGQTGSRQHIHLALQPAKHTICTQRGNTLTLTKPPAQRMAGRLKCCNLSLFSTGYSGVEVHLDWAWLADARSLRVVAKWKRTLLGAYTGDPCII